MSRPLLGLALALFVLLGLAPLLAMLPRLTAADWGELQNPRVLSLLGRTAGLGLSVSAIAVALGLPFGFLVARTDLPGASLWRALMLAPLLIPTLIQAMTWAVFVNWRGAPATAWILGLSYFPLVALFAGRAFERIDRRLEEAARLAGGWRLVLRADWGLVWPAVAAGACLAFTFAVNDFGVPDYVSSVGRKFNVYADEIFANWNQVKRPGLAVATALPLMGLSLLVLWPVLRLRRQGSLAALGSAFEAPGLIPLRAYKWPALLFVVTLIGLSTALPIGRLIFEAGGKDAWSLAQFSGSLRTAVERARPDLVRSLTYAGSAALLCVPLGLVLGHAIERAPRRWGRALELLCMLPLVAPATLFAIGVIVLWSRPGLAGVYHSELMPVMVYSGRLAAFAVLILSGAVASMEPDLEAAGALAGAGPARRLVRLVAPPLWPSLVASGLLVFAFSLRELDTSILVPAANRTAILRVYNGVHFSRDAYVAGLSLVLLFVILTPGLLWSLFARRRLEILP
jgi:iron(III) transport system permease protein